MALDYEGDGTPIYDESVIVTAVRRGVDPEILDWHVEAVHGWEPHDTGYASAVEQAADCLQEGGCE